MRRKLAFQGERGAFSEEAATKLLGKDIELVPCPTFEETFDHTEAGKTEFSLVPIENSLAGSVHENYDLLLQKSLRIVGEVNLRVVHNLIGVRRAPLDGIKKVYSHPVALAQCQAVLKRLSHVEQIPAYDTAGSVKMIVERQLGDSAAIASKSAAEFYGAEILAEGIEDNKENYTRFFLLSKGEPIHQNASKTSIVVALPHQPGSLFKALSVFALRDLSLTKIESRPIHGRPWEYFFYIDFLGSAEEKQCKNALRHLEEIAEFVKILGSYPRASD